MPDRLTALAGDGDTGLKHCRGTSGQHPRDRCAGGETSFILLLMCLVLVWALPGRGLSRFCGGSTVAHAADGLSTTRWYYYQGAAGPGASFNAAEKMYGNVGKRILTGTYCAFSPCCLRSTRICWPTSTKG